MKKINVPLNLKLLLNKRCQQSGRSVILIWSNMR